MYISVQLSLSKWSFQQTRRTEITRIDWSKTYLTQELVSLSALKLKQKIPVKNTKQELQWSTSAGVLTTNTKTATRFSLPTAVTVMALSTAKTKAPPPGSAKSSKQELNTSLSIQQRITRGSPDKWTSWKKKLPTKGPSTWITRS